MRIVAFGGSALAAMSLAAVVHATPVPLPFTYPYETLERGAVEDEIYADVTPLRVANTPKATPAQLWEPAYVLQNEIELGVTDHVELAWYQVFEGSPQNGGSNSLTFDGLKFRGRFRVAEAGDLPLDLSFYLELETLHDEISLEEKILLARRFGRFHWMANLWVEQEDNRPFDGAAQYFDFVVNPTTGFTYQVTPVFQPGIEYWGRGTFFVKGATGVQADNLAYKSFLGPTVHLDWGKVWWSLGVYVNLNDVGTPAVGSVYGPVWIRSLLGLSF